jgi:hypothetical protein
MAETTRQIFATLGTNLTTVGVSLVEKIKVCFVPAKGIHPYSCASGLSQWVWEAISS